MEQQPHPSEENNVEYLRPIQPELVVAWHGLEIVVTNTRMSRDQIIRMLENMELGDSAA